MKETPINILYVDDDPEDVELVKAALAHTCVDVKYKLIIGEHGEHAIDLLKDSSFDLVILDFNLPKISGGELLHHIRMNPALKHLPVILLTGSDFPSMFDKARELGISALFQKPFDLQNFRDVFREICHDWFAPLAEAKGSTDR
jgi:CheY-like chemotaxis protein